MNEVSSRVTALVLDSLDERSILYDHVLETLGFTREELRDRATRIDWDRFVRFMATVEGLLARPSAMEALFAPESGRRTDHGMIRLIANITSPQRLFEMLARWAIPSDIRVATAHCETLDARRLRLTLSLDARRTDSPATLRFFTGVLRHAPALMGLPTADVVLTLAPHVAEYEIRADVGPSLLSATRRGIAALLGNEAIEELARQQDEIVAQNHALERQLADLRRVEDELRRSEARFRGAADGSLDAFFLMQSVRDASGRVVDLEIVDLNLRAAAMLDRAREDLVGSLLCEVRPVNRSDGFLDKYIRVIETRQALEEEFSIDLPEGKRWRRHQVVPVGDGIAITTRDITDNVLAARAMRENDERLRLALEAARLSTFSWDLQTNVITWPGGADATLWSRDGDQDRTFDDYDTMIHPDDRAAVHEALRRTLSTGAPYDVEHRVMLKDGSIRWVAGKGTRFVDAEGKATKLLGTVADITERKRLESRLLLADRMISVGTLAAGVAHEINNPLTYVSANVEQLQKLMPLASHQLDPELIDDINRAIHAISDGARRVRDIVRDLKTFSRPDEDRRTMIDLRQVISASVRMVRADMKFRATLVEEYAEVPPLLGNESRLGQVFINLLVNASHAMPERAESLNVIKIRTALVDDASLAVEVEDNGVGMSAETTRKIFDPFFTTKGVGEGTGLGLSVCHGIVQELGGRIEVESTLGKGTRFRVVLPIATAPRPAAPRSEPARVKARVLVVDDEPILIDIMRTMLEDDGHEVVTTTSAREGLALLLGNDDYDVIMCDLMMPELTGMDIHARLFERSPEAAARMVFVTGGAVTQRARTFLDRTPNLCLDKPFTGDELASVVARTLASNASRLREEQRVVTRRG